MLSDERAIRDIVNRLFDAARQDARTDFDPDRLLGSLTSPSASRGGRVKDNFAGRRRFVRFMHSVQLAYGILWHLPYARGIERELRDREVRQPCWREGS
jgi:hypothetical protein